MCQIKYVKTEKYILLYTSITIAENRVIVDGIIDQETIGYI